MREITIAGGSLSAMADEAVRAYPEECCGFLLARPEPEARPMTRRVVAIEPARNDAPAARTGRFEIPADRLRDAERRAEDDDRCIVGFYHSHPDRPARPSTVDQAHAWPWYSYVLLEATSRGIPEIAAFELGPRSRVFRPVRLRRVLETL